MGRDELERKLIALAEKWGASIKPPKKVRRRRRREVLLGCPTRWLRVSGYVIPVYD